MWYMLLPTVVMLAAVSVGYALGPALSTIQCSQLIRPIFIGSAAVFILGAWYSDRRNKQSQPKAMLAFR